MADEEDSGNDFGVGDAVNIAADIIGMGESKSNAKKAHERSKRRIRYAVNDAKLAGLHPLAALGMNPYSGAAVTVGGDPAQGVRAIANRYYDAAIQEKVSSSSLNQALAAEADTRAALNNIQTREAGQRIGDAEGGKNLYVKYKDNIQAFGKDVKMWVLDEGAAEGMEGSLPKYMTIYANKKLFANTIDELMSQIVR